ncbi:MAG: methyltransferase domain-containing protein [Candidatus Hodarchaeota archaeon]
MLDIGCGNFPKGDVNCDLYWGTTPHIMDKKNIIDPKKILNFILASGEFLPLKDNSFDIVNASQVLEHILTPPLLLREMKRVSKDIVMLDVPNLRRFFPEKNPKHLYTWSHQSLRNLLELFYDDVIIIGSNYGEYIPSRFMKLKLIGFIFRFLELFMKKIFGMPFIKAICKS